jgi:hypothetical protein
MLFVFAAEAIKVLGPLIVMSGACKLTWAGEPALRVPVAT